MTVRRTGRVRSWECDKCKSRAATLAYLRRSFEARRVSLRLLHDAWQAARRPGAFGRRSCPACTKQMRVVAPGPQQHPELDVCVGCQLLWFDAGEFEALKRGELDNEPQDEEVEHLPIATRVELATADADARATATGAPPIGWAPAHTWQWLPAVFGLPWEENAPSVRVRPLVTWLVSAAVLIASLVAFSDLDAYVERYALIPSEAMRSGGITFLTSFFLHAGWVHLLGNLYFLIVFGDNVEETLGAPRFLLLLVTATILGGVAHVVFDPSSTVPCIGASGGISGVLAFYALRFPHGRVGMLLWFWFYPLILRFPVFVAFLLWAGVQIFVAWMHTEGLTNVSGLAHLGGALAGVLFWLAFGKELSDY